MDQHIRRTDDADDATARRKKSGKAKITDFYEIGETLGKGGFGEVKIGSDLGSGKTYAVKVLSKLKFAAESDRENMKLETSLMAKVTGHPNVVNLHETYEDRGNFYLVMDLCQGGELMDRIVQSKHFSERVASRYFKQMLSALKHCHDHHVVHRDLKPENFLFQSHSETAALMLTDFGLSTYIATPDTVIRDACGSAYYIAPEVFTRRYTRMADVWSLGIILYLLLAGTVPFGYDAEEENEVYEAIQKEPLRLEGSVWSKVSGAAKELVVGLLEKDPSKRYTVEEALAHPWVAGDAAVDVAIPQSVVSSMYNFNARNKFKKAALKLIASTLSAADVQNLRRVFHEIDTDNTGSISFAEMAAALDRMGWSSAEGTRPSAEDVRKLMSSLDTDGDGTINYEEFLVATAERQLVSHQNNIWWAFCEYDRDGDGTITAEELGKVMSHETPEKIAQYIAEYDRDKDGRINYEEFMRMVLPPDLKYKISTYN
jgi:calcium-dependent protein kinase